MLSKGTFSWLCLRFEWFGPPLFEAMWSFVNISCVLRYFLVEEDGGLFKK